MTHVKEWGADTAMLDLWGGPGACMGEALPKASRLWVEDLAETKAWRWDKAGVKETVPGGQGEGSGSTRGSQEGLRQRVRVGVGCRRN